MYRVEKVPAAARKQGTYRIVAPTGLILKRGHDLAGVLRSIEGGGLKAEVMTYQNGGTYERWRQLGKPSFEDIKLQIGMAMSEPFYKWIEEFFKGNADRKNGAIVAGRIIPSLS